MFPMCSQEGMKTRIDLEYLRMLLAVRLSVADRFIFRDMWQQRARQLREQRRDQLVDFLTQGWEAYELAGSADPAAHRHDIPYVAPLHMGDGAADTES